MYFWVLNNLCYQVSDIFIRTVWLLFTCLKTSSILCEIYKLKNPQSTFWIKGKHHRYGYYWYKNTTDQEYYEINGITVIVTSACEEFQCVNIFCKYPKKTKVSIFMAGNTLTILKIYINKCKLHLKILSIKMLILLDGSQTFTQFLFIKILQLDYDLLLNGIILCK